MKISFIKWILTRKKSEKFSLIRFQLLKVFFNFENLKNISIKSYIIFLKVKHPNNLNFKN